MSLTLLDSVLLENTASLSSPRGGEMLFRCRATGFRTCVTGRRRKGIARDLGEVAVAKVGSREPCGVEGGGFPGSVARSDAETRMGVLSPRGCGTSWLRCYGSSVQSGVCYRMM